jgi:hypothetical protein
MMSPLVTKAPGVSFSFDDIRSVKNIFSRIIACNYGFKVIGKSLLDRQYLALTPAQQSEYEQWCDYCVKVIGQIKDYMAMMTETSDFDHACNVLAQILMCHPLQCLFGWFYGFAHDYYLDGKDCKVAERSCPEDSVDRLYDDYKEPIRKCCNDPVPLVDPVSRFKELTEEKHKLLVNGVTTTVNKWYYMYDELYMDTKNKKFNMAKKYILDNIMNCTNAALISSV